MRTPYTTGSLLALTLLIFGCGGSDEGPNGSPKSVTSFRTLAEPSSSTWSQALDVSGDGTVAVGTAETSDLVAVRWSRESPTELTRSGATYTEGAGVSMDGSVVVGGVKPANGPQHAFRWTGGALTDLGGIGAGSSFANGVSGDGTTIVGWAANGQAQPVAMRWTSATGMIHLGTLGGDRSMSLAASQDGSRIVGWSRKMTGVAPFLWTSQGGMVDLGTLGGTDGTAESISADGTIIVGSSSPGGLDRHAFRWTQSTGLVDLEVLTGESASEALDVSADGSVIVGRSGSRAVLWIDGMIADLNASHADVITQGWKLTSAEGVSADGRTIAGVAEDADGDEHAFLIRR